MLQLLARNNGLIGVDVGAQCVKVAQLARRSGELVLERAVIFDRPSIKPGDVLEAAFQADDLGELLRGCDEFSGNNAAATLSMLACEYKTESLESHLAETEVDQVARRLAARESQLGSRLQHDHWMTPGGSDNAMLHVLATSAHVADRITKQHRAAGLACVALDGLPTALARAVTLGGFPDNTPTAAIDWGCARVTICVALRGKPVFVRTIARGTFAAFLQPLCNEFHLTPRESSQILTAAGLPHGAGAEGANKTQTAIAKLTAQGLNEFQQELAKTLSFLRGRHKAFYPQQIVLFGGGATIANIGAYVSAAADLPASVWTYRHAGGDNSLHTHVPMALLGPAIALSALAWEAT